MQWGDEHEETYYAVGEPEDDLLGISDDPRGDYPIGVAVGVGTLATSRGELPLFYLVVDGRELPGTWTLRAGAFTRGDGGPGDDRPTGYRRLRQLIA